MQIARNATLLAALAVTSVSMLIDTASAVEVSDLTTPLLSTAQRATQPQREPPPQATPPSHVCFILGARSFTIPFTVDAGGTQPIEVHLFVSRGDSSGAPDQWTLLDRKRPDIAVKEFQFIADEDGEFWFATRTIDAQGHPHPNGTIEPQLKVFVDTTKPFVTFNADADASGRVDATMRINDATPLKNIQLRYVTDNVNQWQTVDVRQLPPDGSLHFTPPDPWKQLSLQFVATDTPGNQSVVSQLLQRPRLASIEGRYASAPIGESIGESIEALPMPYRMKSSEQVRAMAVAGPVIQLDRKKPHRSPNHVVAGGYTTDSPSGVKSAIGGFRGAAFPSQQSVPHQQMRSQLAPAPSNSISDLSRLFQLPQRAPASQQRGAFGPPSIYGSMSPTRTLTENVLPPPATPEEISNGFDLNGPAQAQPAESQSAQSQSAQSQSGQWKSEPALATKKPEPQPSRARTAAEAMRPLSEQSAVPESNREEIKTPKPEIDPNADRYKAKRSTPADPAIAMARAPVRYSDSERFSLAYELEAVGSYGVDAIELYGSVDSGRSWSLWGKDPDRSSPFDIETKEEGVFGFRIVVVGRNGLASPRPQSGETPDIVVVIDKQKPQARITGAQYGEGDRIGSLVIQYEVEDANLMTRPIALSFSDDVQGPWTTIAAGLRNDGDYVWPADPQLPRKLYLRIDATDQAGNVGTYILDQPIDAQGLAPRARIRGFQSLSGAEPPATGEQTAKRRSAAFK
jgi:hypothetical protein